MHRFVPDLETGDTRASVFLPADQLVALKKRVRALLDLPEDAAVIISEIACADTGCPLLETTIAIFPENAPDRRWQFTRPRAALTEMMLRQTLAGKPARAR